MLLWRRGTNVATGEVTSLEHELRDNAVEGRASVSETLLAGAESAEILGGLGDNVVVKLEGHSAFACLADADVKIDAAAFGGCCVGHF